jgi:hypothetical protein
VRVSASSGAIATAFDTGAATATGAASRLPHSVQNAESGSPCAPHEEQTGRVTVTAAEGCTLAGIGLPHDVQKLADSSTSLPHDVQSAIHFAPGILDSINLETARETYPHAAYFPAEIFSTSCE